MATPSQANISHSKANEVLDAFQNQKIGMQDLKAQDPESYHLVLNAKTLKFNENVAERNKD